jgi:hypothetical protein
MGVDIKCNDKGFGCGYGTWNDIRIQIIKATFIYLEKKFEEDLQNPLHLDERDDDNYYGEGSYYYYTMNHLKKFMSIIRQNMEINNVIRTCYNMNYIDSLNYFGVGGLFALCNKNDCDGYYSPGNSYDICNLLTKIEAFMEKENYIYEKIYVNDDEYYCDSVFDTFKESSTTGQYVRIC